MIRGDGAAGWCGGALGRATQYLPLRHLFNSNVGWFILTWPSSFGMLFFFFLAAVLGQISGGKVWLLLKTLMVAVVFFPPRWVWGRFRWLGFLDPFRVPAASFELAGKENGKHLLEEVRNGAKTCQSRTWKQGTSRKTMFSFRFLFESYVLVSLFWPPKCVLSSAKLRKQEHLIDFDVFRSFYSEGKQHLFARNPRNVHKKSLKIRDFHHPLKDSSTLFDSPRIPTSLCWTMTEIH